MGTHPVRLFRGVTRIGGQAFCATTIISRPIGGAAMTAVEPTGALLEAKGITVKFGGLTALNAVDLSVPEGKLIGLLGPNGAGKSTMFNVCSGFQRATTGQVFLSGQEITNATPQGRARLGLARTFQQPEVFFGLTVREHFVLSYRVRHQRSRLWKDLFTPSSLRKASAAETERTEYLVELLKVEDIADALSRYATAGQCPSR